MPLARREANEEAEWLLHQELAPNILMHHLDIDGARKAGVDVSRFATRDWNELQEAIHEPRPDLSPTTLAMELANIAAGAGEAMLLQTSGSTAWGDPFLLLELGAHDCGEGLGGLKRRERLAFPPIAQIGGLVAE